MIKNSSAEALEINQNYKANLLINAFKKQSTVRKATFLGAYTSNNSERKLQGVKNYFQQNCMFLSLNYLLFCEHLHINVMHKYHDHDCLLVFIC